MEWSTLAQASYRGRIAPPGSPNTSVTPSASRQRMTASAPVIRRLSMDDRFRIRLVGKLCSGSRVVRQLGADLLADLPRGVRAAAVDLVSGGDAAGRHRGTGL